MNNNRLEILKEMLSKDESDSFIRYALAKEYESLHEYQFALKEFEILKSNDPMYVGLYFHLGKLHEKMENFQKALDTYAEGITVSKKIKDFHALSELNSAKLNLEMEM